MKKMLKIFILIVIICIVIYVISKVIFPLTTLAIFNRNISDEKIIENFNSDIEFFEKAVEELRDFEAIYLSKKGNSIEIFEHKKLENGTVDIIQIDKEQFDKYESSIYLLEKLKLEGISKYGNNIDFGFHSSMRGAQSIVILDDKKEYENSGHIIEKAELVRGNWYYIEWR